MKLSKKLASLAVLLALSITLVAPMVSAYSSSVYYHITMWTIGRLNGTYHTLDAGFATLSGYTYLEGYNSDGDDHVITAKLYRVPVSGDDTYYGSRFVASLNNNNVGSENAVDFTCSPWQTDCYCIHYYLEIDCDPNSSSYADGYGSLYNS